MCVSLTHIHWGTDTKRLYRYRGRKLPEPDRYIELREVLGGWERERPTDRRGERDQPLAERSRARTTDTPCRRLFFLADTYAASTRDDDPSSFSQNALKGYNTRLNMYSQRGTKISALLTCWSPPPSRCMKNSWLRPWLPSCRYHD